MSSASRCHCSARIFGRRLDPLVAPGQRDHRRQRDGKQTDPAADGGGRTRAATRRTSAAPGPRCRSSGPGGRAAPPPTSTAAATSATWTGCCSRPPPPGTGSTSGSRRRSAPRPGEQREQPGQVPVAGRAVDHGRPQDRPRQRRTSGSSSSAASRTALERAGSAVVTAVVETNTARSSPAPSRRARRSRGVPEAERRQVDQRVAPRAGEDPGERRRAVVKVAVERRRAARGHLPRRLGRARERDAVMPAAGRLVEHVPAEEPASSGHQEPHRATPRQVEDLPVLPRRAPPGRSTARRRRGPSFPSPRAARGRRRASRSRRRASRCPPAAPRRRRPRRGSAPPRPATEPITALPAARYSNILDGMNVANSGTSRSGTRQMSAAASSPGISALGTPGSSTTLRSPSSATRRSRRRLSAPSPTNANRTDEPTGRRASRAAASAIAVSACEIPCVPA